MSALDVPSGCILCSFNVGRGERGEGRGEMGLRVWAHGRKEAETEGGMA